MTLLAGAGLATLWTRGSGAKAATFEVMHTDAEWRALLSPEAYHQNVLTIHPDSLYIATFDLPKISALQRVFPADFQADPVLVRMPKGS